MNQSYFKLPINKQIKKASMAAIADEAEISKSLL